MTPDAFAALAVAILRTSVGWQTKIARRLGKEPRTIRRWVAGDYPIPDDVAAAMVELAGKVDTSAVWPRGEWLVGEDEAGRALVYHMQHPRFVARVVALDAGGEPEDDEGVADVVSGLVYVASGDNDGEIVLCEIDWIDEPSPGEITLLLDAASDAWLAERQCVEIHGRPRDS